MIFLHLLVGIFLGVVFGHFWAFLIGSVLPDIDHIYVYFIRQKIRSWDRFVDVLKHESRYGVRSKTPLVHSLLGAALLTGIVGLFWPGEAVFFGIAYVLHLVLDIPDTDEKQYFFPFGMTFKGPLPVWSRLEQGVTVAACLVLVVVLLTKMV